VRKIIPSTGESSIRLVMMPRDTNPDGTIFGGVILSLMDQAAYVEAVRQCHGRYVTVSFREVEFHQPVFVGDLLSIYADATRIGRSSMTVTLRVTARRKDDPSQIIEVTQGEVVFVHVDDNGKPKVFEESGE